MRSFFFVSFSFFFFCTIQEWRWNGGNSRGQIQFEQRRETAINKHSPVQIEEKRVPGNFIPWEIALAEGLSLSSFVLIINRLSPNRFRCKRFHLAKISKESERKRTKNCRIEFDDSTGFSAGSIIIMCKTRERRRNCLTRLAIEFPQRKHFVAGINRDSRVFSNTPGRTLACTHARENGN